MKSYLSLPFLVAACLGLISPALAAPVVTNLTASQRTGTKLVDIAYDVAAPGFPTVAVSLEISSDAGATWTVPTASATGHVGAGVAPGAGKAIVWDAGVDWAGNYSTQMRFRVVADDLVPAGLALIPGGSFTMGATSGDTDSDAPPVTVTVGTFYLAETETTKAQWDTVRTWALAHSSPYTDLAAGAGKSADHPVQMVSWWDVVKWCNARSEMEGLTPVYTVGGAVMRTGTTAPDVNWAANGYRLPTEAEWEKAARGGVSGKRFPWGTDTISHTEANFRNVGGETHQSGTTDYHPTYATGGFPYTSPVGSFAANGFGLNDMAGNVWEWCWDWYAADTYAGGATDPRGPASGTARVARGGSWAYSAFYARASDRNYNLPNDPYNYFGFRTARTHIVDDFALIPGGSFTMGVTSGDPDTDGNAPSISVTLSSFYLAETETSFAQWESVRVWAASNSYNDLAIGAGKTSEHPVQAVGWWDVVKWCNARSEMEGLTPVYTVGGAVMRTGTTVPDVNWSANGYRLPTEAEWEKAARGGVSGMRFPWGTDAISHADANFRNNGGELYQSGTTDFHPTYATGGQPYTSPVGSFAANDFGIKDMAGNVWELCWDWYEPNYYGTSNGTTDPRGPLSGTYKIVRGGSWINSAVHVRAAVRSFTAPSDTLDYVGFRTARSSVPDSGHGIATTSDVTVDTRSDNADLSALTLGSGTLDQTFASGTITYTASVANATTSITVTPTRAQANATIEVRVGVNAFASVTSGSPSDALALNVGANTVDVRVTAQDTTTTKTYTITVTRRAAPTITSPTNTLITATSATLGGNITAEGAASITERGVVYAATATNSNPLIGGAGVAVATEAGAPGVFNLPVTGLDGGTTYAFKAYATNSDGTFYSGVAIFVTNTLVVFDSGSATFNRSILPGGRQVFNFTLTGPRIVSLSTLVGAALRAELYDSEGNLVTSFAGDANFALEDLLLAGDYAFHVYRQSGNGAAQTFDLTIDASVVAASRPDVAVGRSAVALTGRSIYSPASQIARLTSKKLRAVTGYAQIDNRGKLPDVLAVSGGRGTRFFKVVWSGPAGNVTAALNAGTYRTGEMADGTAPVSLSAKITPNKKKLTKTNKKTKRTTIVKKTFLLSLRASSTFDPAISDAATIQVKTK